MTVWDIEEDVRIILNDTYEDAYRFEPKEVFKAMVQGMVNTRNVRPESRYVNGLLVDLTIQVPQSFTTSPNGGTLKTFRERVLEIENRWREPLVFYVVSRMYMKDDADTQNANLVTQYTNLYNTTVQT